MKHDCLKSPRVLRDNKWCCSECDAVLDSYEYYEQLQFEFSPYKIPTIKKCDCGSDKTFGENSYTHSYWCSSKTSK